MSKRTRKPRPGSEKWNLRVMPSRKALVQAISQNGYCNPTDCWHYVAIFALLSGWFPETKKNWVRVDAGHVKVRIGDWWYKADTPAHVKRSLMLFDKRRYEEVRAQEYTLHFRRDYKVRPMREATKKELQNYAASRTGGVDKGKRQTRGLRARVEGFSALV